MQLMVTFSIDAAGLVHASAAALPDIQAVGTNRAQALAAFQSAVADRLAVGDMALVDIMAPVLESNPWTELAGSFADDPDIIEIMHEAYERRDAEPPVDEH